MYSAIWKWVPATYYDWPLEQRAKCLGAKSTQLLCKALLMDNKQSDGMDPWTNPKFVLVVLQYDSTLDVRKLANSIRSLKAVIANSFGSMVRLGGVLITRPPGRKTLAETRNFSNPSR